MTIYLDYIFLENLVINAIIIIIVNNFLNLKFSFAKIAICILTDTIFSILNYLYFSNVIFSIIISIISFLIIFRKCFKTRIQYLKACVLYFVVYILFIGIIIVESIVFNLYLDNILNKLAIYFSSALFLNYGVLNLWKVWKSNIRQENLSVKIKINEVLIDGFIDTGNTVKDLHGLNVIFIKSNFKDEILKDISNYSLTYVDILTLNGSNTERGYVVKNVKLIYDNSIITIPMVVLCFSLNSNTPEKYSAIIGYDIYLDNFCGGV